MLDFRPQEVLQFKNGIGKRIITGGDHLMTPKQIVALAVRLFAIWLAIPLQELDYLLGVSDVSHRHKVLP